MRYSSPNLSIFALLMVAGCAETHVFQTSTDTASIYTRGIAAGDDYSCAIDRTLSFVCWGSSKEQSWSSVKHVYVEQISVAAHRLVGFMPAVDGDGNKVPENVMFEMFDSDIDPNGVPYFFGMLSGFSSLPDAFVQEPMAQVSVGGTWGCGIGDITHQLWCFDTFGTAEAFQPLLGEFKRFDMAETHLCAVERGTGKVLCTAWNGFVNYGQLTPPEEGPFKEISIGEKHGCAIRRDGALACWGENSDGQSEPPNGRYSRVSVGGAHSCGIKADSAQVLCWGNNDDGQSSPPNGEMVSIAAGKNHSCSLKYGGEFACWGDDSANQISGAPTFKNGLIH